MNRETHSSPTFWSEISSKSALFYLEVFTEDSLSGKALIIEHIQTFSCMLLQQLDIRVSSATFLLVKFLNMSLAGQYDEELVERFRKQALTPNSKGIKLTDLRPVCLVTFSSLI